MKFTKKLIRGRLIKRYKRFLADIELENGEIVTAHCPNSGSMKSCMESGWQVMLSEHTNPGRKYRYTWEMIHNGKCWIGINTGMPNQIAEEAIQAAMIPELYGYHEIRREKKYGQNSRIDLLLIRNDQQCFVEVKNVTLVEADGCYYFPDAVTDRGRKHLYELMSMIEHGHRAVMLFIVQRSDGNCFRSAVLIDPEYAESLLTAHRQGVEVLVYRAEVSPGGIELAERISWKWD